MTTLEELRHSCAHLLAAAVMKLYPDAKRTIGPAIEDGFYYDFEFSKPISENDLKKIEEKMREILPSWKRFEKIDATSAQAKKEFKDNKYKLELIDEFSKEGKKLTLYKSGEYLDLCKGGHSENPAKDLQNFKLLKLAGAYWRGNEKNKMLTRIYGTAFATKKELDDYLKMLEEAKKRDHKVLGKELDLFIIDEKIGKGLPLWTPKGTIIKSELENFTRELERKYSYQHVCTPYLGNEALYKQSGHLDHFSQNMYKPIDMDGEKFYLRPMACPHHIRIFMSKSRSYKELPIRYAEIADYNRYEKSGELMGMIRLRKFLLTDGHIFVAPEQLKEEFKNVVKIIQEGMKGLGITDIVTYRFSKHDPKDKKKYYPDPELWAKSESLMKEALDELKINYYEAEGEAAFYGPKLDIQAKNVNGKEDTFLTAQMDFLLPEKFDIKYTDENGKEKRPVMIHRSTIGALERTFALLIEHYAGKFPVWLSPVQVVLMTIADRHNEYARKLEEEMKKEGIRVEVDDRAESIGKKVRDNQVMKIPYLITLGDKEIETNNLAIRTRDNKVVNLNKDEFIKKIKEEIRNRIN